jgi:CRP/FNR family transcriptional regulator, anaerobic regulatory protein
MDDHMPDSALLTGCVPAELVGLLRGAGRIMRLPQKAQAFRAGAPCEAYLVVLSGVVKVQLTADTGREIILYRVGQGESCILTVSCLLADKQYAAEGVCETPVTVLAIPAARFGALLGESAAFRDFVLKNYAERIADLILIMEETVFHAMPKRLAGCLLDHACDGRVVSTHQALAADLGTAREVVSRQLKEFERRGLVLLSRGVIELADTARLGVLAGRGAGQK